MAARPVLLACVLMALAGCSDGDPDDGGPASTTSVATTTTTTTTATTAPASTSQSTTSTAPPAPQTVQKDVQDNSFPDGTFTLRAGDTVVWTHRGSAPHSVTSDGNFDSHPNCTFATSALSCMQGGDTYSRTFDAAGSFDYRCRIHGAMTGTITVTE